jgi:S-adenosylmethionine:tRNA ribosyltransferase-isomerase
MKLSEFSYYLPKNKIAQYPPKNRGDAKLLVLNKRTGEIQDKKYQDLVNYLESGDVLVLNKTKVIKARLIGLGSDGKQHEILLTEKHGYKDEQFHHKVMYRGKLVEGMELTVGGVNLRVIGVYGDGTALLESPIDFMKLANQFGHVPLPPYMKRDDTSEDVERYQTEFAADAGSVAAPTASLNMTKALIDQIKARGVKVCYITLHVGLGTFMPIRTDNIKKHKMHSEWFMVPEETSKAILEAKNSEGNVWAIGTTVVRTLEYAYQSVLAGKEVSGEADIFIYPGYEFKIVDKLLTNFHAPKSTVLMLAAAFAGWSNLSNAYEYAIKNKYKFLSYGDSMLVI